MLDDMYIAMLKGDTLSGRPSSGSYVNQIHDNLTLVFEAAKKEGILVFNPCDKANPPKMDTKAKRALSPAQAHKFIESLDPESDRQCAYLLAITMGLAVARSAVCHGETSTSTARSRTSATPTTIMESPRAPRRRPARESCPSPTRRCRPSRTTRKLSSSATPARTSGASRRSYIEQIDDSPVISDNSGTRVLPTSLSRWWIEDRPKFGLDGWCLHEFRHTYLTLLAINRVHPKVMRELAGHYSSQISMDIYTHVNMDSKRQAVESVSAAF